MGRFVSLDTKNHLPSTKSTDTLNETGKKSGRFVKAGDTSKIGANSNARFRVESDVSGEAWTRATPSQTKLKSGYTSSQEREISKLQEQRRQAQVDLDTDAMNAADRRMKEIRAAAGKQTAADRVSDVLSTAASGYGRDIASTIGTASNAVNDPDYYRRQIKQAQNALSTGRLSDGNPVTDAMRQKLQENISAYQQKISELEGPDSFTNRTYQAANRMDTDSKTHAESAKQGLGTVGQFAVDVGVAGAQMGGDVLLGMLTGGSALVPMAVRSFGSGAQEARQSSASIGQQVAYGLGSAALSTATEKIANVAGPFKKAFGAGVLDKSIGKAVERMGNSAVGKTALSVLSEGGEEMLEDLLQPILQRATYDPDALVHYQDADYWANMLYDGLVGGALGGVGAGVEQIGNRIGRNGQKGTVEAAGTQTEQTDGNSMGALEIGVEGVSGGIMEQEVQRLFGQQKAASTGETANSRLTDADTQEYLRIGDRKHVRDQKAEILRSGDSPVLTTPDKIKAFIQDSFVGKVRDTIKAYGKVGKTFADRVRSATNGEVVIDGYYLELDSNKISHMNDHVGTDKDPRSIPLTQAQIEQLPEYIDTFDDLIDVIRRKDGSVRLMLGKKINGHSIIIEAVSKGRKALHPVTAYQVDTAHYESNYKTKAVDRSSTSQPAHAGDVDISRPATTFDDTVSQDGVGVNPSQAGADDGLGAANAGDGVGARTSQFPRKERVSTAKSVYEQADHATDADRAYDATSDAERLTSARERLQMDYDGEKQYLKDTPEWSGEDYAVAKLIQSDIRKQAQESGDFSEFRKWSRDIQKHASFFGQDLQSLKMWVEQSADKAVGDAAAVLETAKEAEAGAALKGKARVTDEVINNALGDIAVFGERAESLTNSGDTSGLYDLVIELAAYRGYKPSKTIKKALSGCTVQQLTDIAWSEISGISLDAIPPSSGQYISTYQYLSHLLNAKTLLRNVTANSVFSPIESAFTNNIASIVDRLAASVVGGYQSISTAQARTVGMEKGPFSKAGWKGGIEGAKQSAIDVALDISRGSSQNKYESGTNRTFKRHKVKDPLLNLILNTGNNLEGVLGYGLNTTDEFQKGGTEAKVRESLQGILNTDGSRVTPEMVDKFVENEQLYRSFQRDTAVGNLLQASKDYMNIIGFGTSNGKTRTVAGHSFAVKDFGLGDFIGKYTRVPGALATTLAEYTDLGCAKALYNLGAMAYSNAQVKKGRGDSQVGGRLGAYSNMTNADAAVYSQRAFAQNIARVLTGKGLMMACSALAKMGILHFTGDDDKDEATVKATQGLSGLQINLSALGRLVDGEDASLQDGDIMLDASSLEPVNGLMEGGARMAYLEDDADYSAKMDIIVDTIVNSFTDLSMMQNVKTVQNAFTYKSDDETWGDVIKEAGLGVLSGSASGFVPGPVRQAANYFDDYYRDTSSDTQMGKLKNSMISAIPAARETLPERVTPLGEKREKTTDGGIDFFTSFISPFNVTRYQQSAVVDAMDETGVYAARSAPKKVTADGKTVELNTEQQRQYQADRGTQLVLTVTDMLGNRQYKQAGDTQKQDLMADAREYANYVAKASVIGKDSVPQWAQKTMDAQRATGLSAATVIVYRDMLSRAKDNGQKSSDANSAVREAIFQDSTLNTAQMAALDDIVISDDEHISKDLKVDYTNNETFIISQMSDGAQKRYTVIKNQFGMDAETYSKAWAIYQNDDLKADQKRQQLSALGYNGSALYKAFGKKME